MIFRALCLTLIASFTTSLWASPDAIKDLMEQAEDHVAEGEFKSALAKYAAADDLSIKSKVNDDREEITSEMAKLYFRLNEFEKAYLLAKTSLRLAENIVSEDYLHVGIYAIKVQRYGEATQYFNQAFKKAQSHNLIADIYFHKALNQKAKGNYAEAILQFEAARKQHLIAKDMSNAAERKLDIANLYKDNLSQYQNAFKYYNEARSEFVTIDDIDGIRRVDIDIANSLVQIGEIPRAITILEGVLKSVDPKEEAYQTARTYQMLANAHFRSGAYEASQIKISKGMEAILLIGDESKKFDVLIDAYNLKAMIEAQQGKRELAFKTFDKAISAATKLRMKRKLAYLYNNLGYWQREFNELENSIASFHKAIKIDREIANEEGLAYDYRNLGLSLARTGDLKNAEYYVHKAMEMSSKSGFKYNLIQSQMGLADIAIRQENWSKAHSFYKKVLEDATISQFRMDEWKAQAGAGQTTWKMGESDLSRKHFESAFSKIELLQTQLNTKDSKKLFKESRDVQEVYKNYHSVLSAMGESDGIAKLEERWKNL